MNILYLASQSFSRHKLLREAQIPFQVVLQSIDEEAYGLSHCLEERVMQIAQAKMDHVRLTAGSAVGDYAWVLTADSLVQSAQGNFFGKPSSYENARTMLQTMRARPCRVATGFCCKRMRWNGTEWCNDEIIVQAVTSSVIFDISDEWIPHYLDRHPCALQTAGVLVVEDYGAQFVKSIEGSYTTVLGLPMFEVRLALEKLKFLAW